MTVEELKAEAKKLGYNIIKIPEKVKKLNCVCGASSRLVKSWYLSGYGAESGLFFRCKKCGRESDVAKKETEAIKNWNALVEKEIEKNYGGEE